MSSQKQRLYNFLLLITQEDYFILPSERLVFFFLNTSCVDSFTRSDNRLVWKVLRGRLWSNRAANINWLYDTFPLRRMQSI